MQTTITSEIQAYEKAYSVVVSLWTKMEPGAVRDFMVGVGIHIKDETARMLREI